ncbi:MAG TPA: dTDP-4-dehydrorhamnose 3,5-epimerase [Vicinamibacterales bacterium]|nr:dTDP-4-dehydrorhamnose 3,5-epimerase [Vicinamibacterales bacterium]
MRFTETTVQGAFLVDPEPRADERGFFARLWCRDEFASHGLSAEFVQCNDSFSEHRGTLRGLHYQAAPYGEVKLVRCVRGAVFDVLVDLRPDSPTYTRWFGAELTAANRRMLYVPEGCAHGYLTLEDQSEVVYPVTCAYRPDAERGVRWNDPRFGIAWPRVEPMTLSPKDRQWPDYEP